MAASIAEAERAPTRRAPVRPLQGGRQEAREAVLPVRDVPRHGDEPRRRVRDRRARVDLEVDVVRAAPRRHRTRGCSGRSTTTPADPGTTNFVPRPDWYFYFLFYLLRIFKWPESVFLGTVGVPTICLILLLALPFIDLRRERRLLRRPVAVVAAVLTVVSMGVLTWKGATAKEALASEVIADVPTWVEQREAAAGGRPGREAVRAAPAALHCHTYLGAGSSNLGAPDLTAIGATEPRRRLPDSPPQVPVAASIRARRCRSSSRSGRSSLRQLAVFLEASKGKQYAARSGVVTIRDSMHVFLGSTRASARYGSATVPRAWRRRLGRRRQPRRKRAWLQWRGDATPHGA